MTSEEISDLCALINRVRPPENGMEIHFLRVLEMGARPCSQKEIEWYQWVLTNASDALKHFSVAKSVQNPDQEISDTTGSCDYEVSTQAGAALSVQGGRKNASMSDIEKANSIVNRICANDFSCIRELQEQQNQFSIEFLHQIISECLEKTQDREIRDRLVRAQRKLYEVEHRTSLPEGGAIVNFGGLHDMRNWDW